MDYIRPRIKPIHKIYRTSNSTFRIGTQLNIMKEFEDPEQEFWELTNLLDGRNLDEILKKMLDKFPHLTKNDILNGIKLLDVEGFIEELIKENEVKTRYSSNINYFSNFINSKGNRFEIQQKIHDSTILLLGIGGGGSNILTLLSGLGPKKVIIVDYDIVEKNNLGRQFLYRESDIDNYKVEIAKKAINKMNSSIEIISHNKKIETPEDILEIIDGENIDIAISAIDEPVYRAFRIVNKSMIKANIPCVYGASMITSGRVFSVIPKETPCVDCIHINTFEYVKEYIKDFTEIKDIEEFDTPSYGPNIFQISGITVDEAIRILTGYKEPRTKNNFYEVDFENGEVFNENIGIRQEKCPTCGTGSEEDFIKNILELD
ncbi:MAG: ThiF family adenylyltransferase [Defluviitaleaceae bacterium]|nr:ThiF family adenylyltransferase [Defluviitaleaceae bacterium]